METKIPQTKQEAFDQLDQMLTKEEKEKMISAGDSIDYHFTLGLWIRNNWIYEQSEEDVNRLAKAFRTNYIVFDPDSLSEKLIESYQKYLKRKNK
jgi:hypothetical protein